MTRSDSPLQHFAASLGELGATRDVDELLQLAVDLPSELIHGCDVADIMFARDGRTTVPAATDPVSRRLAHAQQGAGGGPCLAVFDGTSVELGSVFAAFCSNAIINAIKEDGLRAAIASRDVIGQAKGVLMERHRLTPAEAYTMLREHSQQTNTRIVEIAEHVTATGELP